MANFCSHSLSVKCNFTKKKITNPILNSFQIFDFHLQCYNFHFFKKNSFDRDSNSTPFDYQYTHYSNLVKLSCNFKVRARTRAGFGPFSNAIEIQTPKSSENGIFLAGENVESALPRETETDKTAQIAGAAAGGAVIVIMVIVFLVICTK